MIIVANKPGQLGNRLVVFAHLVAFSLETGVRIANPAFFEYAAAFRSFELDPLCRFPSPARLHIPPIEGLAEGAFLLSKAISAGLARTVPIAHPVWRLERADWEQVVDLDDPEVAADLCSARGVFLQGWLFRGPRRLARNAVAVRRIFSPTREITASVGTVMAEARNSSEFAVGFHIRRGDYAGLHGGAYFYELAAYEAILSRMRQCFGPNTVYVLTSDDSKGLSRFRGNEDVVIGPGTPAEDLFTLAACDLIVGPPSTFSMWASFFGNTPLFPVTHPSAVPKLEDADVYMLDGFPFSVEDDSGPTYW